jgi:diguanylate cyclase (GGDEF)-like protein/PAS domain S-box-containing protein
MSLTTKRFHEGYLTVIAVAVAVAFCGLAVQARRQALDDSWSMAAQAGSNLNRAVAKEIGRTIESLGLSLLAVADNRQIAGVDELAPKLRKLVLFDRAITATHIGVVLVLDEHGSVTIESGSDTPRPDSLADREYFTYHRDHSDASLHISAPYRGRTAQQWVIAVSYRLSRPDGSFAGVVMGTILLDSIRTFFTAMDLGPGGALSLYRDDGIMLMRVPYSEAYLGSDISNTAVYRRVMLAPQGQFVGTATLDNTRRFFTYSRIAGTSLVSSVSFAVADIEANWRRQTLYVGLITLGLVGALTAASLRFHHELRKRHAAEGAARQSETTFRLLAENCSDMVTRLGLDGIRRYVSPASQRLLGRSPETLVDRRPQEQVHPDDLATMAAAEQRLRFGGAEETCLTYRARHTSGAWVWIESTLRIVRDPKTGAPDGLIAVSRDVTDRKDLEAQLARLANLDGLTGVANRRSFDEALEREWRRCAREAVPISLLLGDLDHFKAMNDHYGHRRGDECLRRVGAIFAGAVQRAADLSARYGGEEFVILLPGADMEGALTVAERVRAAIEALGLPHIGFGCATAVVTISVGVATLYPMPGVAVQNVGTLIDLADRNLYEAKRAGRNRVVHGSARDDAGPSPTGAREERPLTVPSPLEKEFTP